MNLEEKFKQDLHGGKQKDGLLRYNGHFIGEENDGATTVKFDNGNLYVFKDQKIIQHIDGQDEYFINDQITETVNQFIDSNPLMSKNHSYSDYNSEDSVEFYFNDKTASITSRGTLIRLVINRQSKNIEISNIFLDPAIRFQGFGKQIIKKIWEVALRHDYRLFLVQMVPGFYERMIKRGAKNIAFEDIVEITKSTAL